MRMDLYLILHKICVILFKINIQDTYKARYVIEIMLIYNHDKSHTFIKIKYIYLNVLKTFLKRF